MTKCENCCKVLTKSGLYKHQKQKCVPQPSEVPECLICSLQFVRIKARNKHYRDVHSVDVNDLACHSGEKDHVLMKLIREHNPSSLIEPTPDHPIEGEIMNQIKCSSDSVKLSDVMPVKTLVITEDSKTYEVDETDVMSPYDTSENDSMINEYSIGLHNADYEDSIVVYDSPPHIDSFSSVSIEHLTNYQDLVTLIDDDRNSSEKELQVSTSWDYNFGNAKSMLSNTDIDVVLQAAHNHAIENKLDCWILSTSFVETIKRTINNKKINKNTQKQKILKKNKIESLQKPNRILSVIFYSNPPHWQLIEIDFSQSLIYIYCSLNFGYNHEGSKDLFEVVTNLTSTDVASFRKLNGVTPQQENGIDCGVYSLVNALNECTPFVR